MWAGGELESAVGVGLSTSSPPLLSSLSPGEHNPVTITLTF